MRISNRFFFLVVMVWLALWAAVELAVKPVTWTCVDGIGEAEYTYVGPEAPHMDCEKN